MVDPISITEEIASTIYQAPDEATILENLHIQYDQEVQNLLDLHWPGITELKNIKRIEGWKGVFSGMLNGE